MPVGWDISSTLYGMNEFENIQSFKARLNDFYTVINNLYEMFYLLFDLTEFNLKSSLEWCYLGLSLNVVEVSSYDLPIRLAFIIKRIPKTKKFC